MIQEIEDNKTSRLIPQRRIKKGQKPFKTLYASLLSRPRQRQFELLSSQSSLILPLCTSTVAILDTSLQDSNHDGKKYFLASCQTWHIPSYPSLESRGFSQLDSHVSRRPDLTILFQVEAEVGSAIRIAPASSAPSFSNPTTEAWRSRIQSKIRGNASRRLASMSFPKEISGVLKQIFRSILPR